MSNVLRAWSLVYEPRKWQREAFALWSTTGRRGIVQVVTGVGKTIFAEMCILDFLTSYPDGKVVIIVPTMTLLDQWFVSLHEDLRVPASDIATFSGDGRPEHPGRVNLMVLNSARKAAPEITQKNRIFLIVDECHRAGSPENSKALLGEHTATLGMSATPEREYDDGLGEYLKPALGPVIFDYGLNDALRDGIIAPFKLTNVAVTFLPGEESQYERITRRLGRAIRVSDGDPKEDPRVTRLLQQRGRLVAQATLRVPVAVRIASQHSHEKDSDLSRDNRGGTDDL